MARIDNLNNFLTDVADSIRGKKGTTDLISPSNFDTEIENIETGGGDLSEYFTESIQKLSTSSVFPVFSCLVKKIPSLPINTTDYSNLFMYFIGEELDVSNFVKPLPTTCFSMFKSCPNLKNIIGLSNIDTRNVLTFREMFYDDTNLIDLDISNFDMSKATNIQNMLYNCTKLTNLQFGKNLGLSYTTNSNANSSTYKLDLSKSTLLTETSLISVLNGLADIASLGVQTQSCVLGSTNLAKLTSEAGQQALAQAQAYGWTVS